MICPPSAGVASALGLLVAPARVDRVATVGVRLDRGDLGALETAFRGLEDEARAVMGDTGLKLETARFPRLADGRFLGQGFDLVVDLPDGPYDGRDVNAVRRALTSAFEAAYREKFSLTPPDVPIEFINVRVAVRPVAGSEVVLQGRSRRGESPVKGRRPVWFPEANGFVDTVVYDRARLAVGDQFLGPAVIEEEGSTLVVPPRAGFTVAATGNVVVTLNS